MFITLKDDKDQKEVLMDCKELQYPSKSLKEGSTHKKTPDTYSMMVIKRCDSLQEN